MMLSTHPFHSHYMHTPPRPSPLSERSANAVPHSFAFAMASPLQNEKKTSPPQRAYKPNPVVQTRDAATQRRRDMFFRRVQKGREDKTWASRDEQIQRLDYFSEHKRWEAKKMREASQLDDDWIEKEVVDMATSSQTLSSAPMPEQVLEEADYLIAQEQHELEELIASLEEEQEVTSQHYGSDDEDYDQIFMEYTTDAETQQPQQFAHQGFSYEDVDAMDTS